MSYNLTGAARGGNQCSTLAGLTGLSGAATTYSTAALTIQYSVGGKAYAKAQVSGGATPTTDAADSLAFDPITANKACVFVWALNAAGTVQVFQGGVVSFTDTTAGSTSCPFPILPDTSTAFAYCVVQGISTVSGNWLLGTSNHNATGITITVTNVWRLPVPNPVTA